MLLLFVYRYSSCSISSPLLSDNAHTYATHPTTTDPRCHLASLQAVARDEAAQVSLLPEAVYLCTEATAATLGQTHSSGMQVRSPTIEQYAQEIALVSFDCYYFLVCEMC